MRSAGYVCISALAALQVLKISLCPLQTGEPGVATKTLSIALIMMLKISPAFSLLPLCLPIKKWHFDAQQLLAVLSKLHGSKRRTDPLCHHQHGRFWLCKSVKPIGHAALPSFCCFVVHYTIKIEMWSKHLFCFNHHTYSFLALINHTFWPILSACWTMYFPE